MRVKRGRRDEQLDVDPERRSFFSFFFWLWREGADGRGYSIYIRPWLAKRDGPVKKRMVPFKKKEWSREKGGWSRKKDLPRTFF